MCGIAGWMGGRSTAPQIGDRVARALRHRGPDATGVKSWDDATLIHTRLSIIDLSPTGAQPMANEDGTIWTVFNGEIYNHRQLRQDLAARGHRFVSRSDTEVLPHLYEEYGTAMVEKLRGMFAVAIYDARRRKLLLLRDRFGIKPLFYSAAASQLMFASEIHALRQMPGIDETPDRQAIFDFAALFFVPAPQTLYRGIRALCPGELLEAEWEGERIRLTIRRYHCWRLQPNDGLSLAEATEQADALIGQAVGRQLESDVPLGTLLSGGVDSSLVTLAAQKAAGRVRSFNVRFSDARYDETWAAVEAARCVGSDHATLEMDSFRGTWDRITSILLQAGQPYADTSVFAASAVCEFMRQHVKVALSGDGGDEAFGGYGSFWRIGLITGWQSLPAVLRTAVARGLAPGLSRLGAFPSRYCERLNELSAADDAGILQSLDSWIRPREHAQLCHDTGLLPIRRWFEPQWEHALPPNASRLERLSAHATEVKMRLRLPNDYLFKVDLASMRSSLEVRVPMLDEDLIQFGLILPQGSPWRGPPSSPPENR
ncbi:MAG: asparagine synthase (glutamine-hydrolyzing) [Verrucomicrobia bacterium]|nr:MAG: asparagine synthase (glutamine-hydrolyzing) [Verrucomicrobiota bacterium]